MAFQIINITDEPSQRHVLLVDDEEIIITLNFYQVSEFWALNVSWRNVTYNGFMLSLGCLHIQSLNWPFDFFVSTTDSSGLAPFRLGDFSEGRCELYFVTAEEVAARVIGQAFFPAISKPTYTGPSLLMDFVANTYLSGIVGFVPDEKSLGELLSFSRASTATYFDSTGVMQAAAIDAPRLDFNPDTLASLGLLIEPAATNVLTWSADFNNAAWTKTSATISASVELAPDGSTMPKIVEGAATSTHRVSRASLTLGTPWEASVFAKAGERTRIAIGGSNSGANGGGTAIFDLSSGSVVSNTILNSTATIESIGGGVYRCAVQFPNTVVTQNLLISIILGTAMSYAGDGVSGLYIWGAQQESGGSVSSYIPTTSAAVTRSADIASIPTDLWRSTPDGAMEAVTDPLATAVLGTPGITLGGVGHIGSVTYTPMIA